MGQLRSPNASIRLSTACQIANSSGGGRASTTCSKRGDVKRTGTTNGIYVAQIRALYQHIPIVLLVNMVNSALVAIVLASYKGQTWWLAFLALTIALTGAHAFGWVCYRHTGELAESASRWAAAATVGSGLSGLLWGVGSALLLPG